MWSWWVNIVGLGISFAGSLFLYFGSPLDSIGFPNDSLYLVLNKEELVNDFFKRRKWSKLGVSLVGFGFLLQLISAGMQYPK